jgi:hypothetical protein
MERLPEATLEEALAALADVSVLYPVEANAVLAALNCSLAFQGTSRDPQAAQISADVFLGGSSDRLKV